MALDDYTILVSDTPEGLATKVKAAAAAGLLPFGSIAVDVSQKHFAQAMVKGDVAGGGGGGGTLPITADNITDASSVGKQVLTAADQAAARTAIGAGTGSSNLAIGATATTAAAGNHTHGAATTAAAGFMSGADKAKLDGIAANANAYSLPAAGVAIGGVKQGVAVADPTSETDVVAQVKALMASLRGSGALAT
ncbi:head fiber protein [Stenotrophomonas sp. NRRL B-14846]|uniref:head fiber protein n=1 Tax=Stenotrophomonas sp. NRRL B-14846 TaxID=3162882 RepID=UPI003D2DB4B5